MDNVNSKSFKIGLAHYFLTPSEKMILRQKFDETKNHTIQIINDITTSILGKPTTNRFVKLNLYLCIRKEEDFSYQNL